MTWAAAARRRRWGADQGAHRQGRQPGDGAGRRRTARLGPGAVPDEGRHRCQLQAPARLVPAPGVGGRGPPRRRQPQPVRRRLGADPAATSCRSRGAATSTSRCSRGWCRRRLGRCAIAPAGCCCTARSSATTRSRRASPTSPAASTRTPHRRTSCGRCSRCGRDRPSSTPRPSASGWPSRLVSP